MSGDSATAEQSVNLRKDGGANPASPLQVKEVSFHPIDKAKAIRFNRAHHSRLPVIHNIGLSYAFAATWCGVVIATAVWSRPISRQPPRSWWELRRMACSPMMPKGGASAFLNWMVRYLKKQHPECPQVISYQDSDVHTGTIYKAAGWTVGAVSKKAGWINHPRPSTRQNGDAPLMSPKVRWQRTL